MSLPLSLFTPLQNLLRPLIPPRPSITPDFFTPTPFPLVITDGSYLPRPLHRSGIGVYFGPDHPFNHSSPLHTPFASSIGAELHAAAKGLQLLVEAYPQEKVYWVLSDNQPVVNVLNQGVGRHEGWMGKRGLQGVAGGLREVMRRVEGRGGRVKGVKVERGGVGGAHRLAKAGALSWAAAETEEIKKGKKEAETLVLVRKAAEKEGEPWQTEMKTWSESGNTPETEAPTDRHAQTNLEDDETCVHVRSLKEVMEEEARTEKTPDNQQENTRCRIENQR